ncbi:RidA family protein [Paracoccus suum]|uniref:RidA family protein n=1 Tax=Paracoccus suum TaxID=2259340 RepID=A0A344PGB6_9RHOB|nr:RidA family protein [Paracoccus suum]
MHPVAGYHHAAIAGGMLIVAGQVARDPQGNWVGAGDAGAQAAQVYRNIGLILAEAGAGPDNVVKITTIMIDRADGPAITAARRAFFGEHRPPHTGFIVNGLGSPEVRVEVEVVAWLGDG